MLKLKVYFSRVSLLTLAVASAVPLQAQDVVSATTQSTEPEVATPEEDPALDENTILVVGARIRGQVQTDLSPILELNEEDIAAYGADSLADLIEQLAPQTGTGRGRGGQPVFLINGQRVSGFREMRRYPPEAIRKVEVLPEEVALQYGYPADQRVINFIMKENFASRELEAEYGGPTAGGRANGEVEASQLTINGAQRLSLGIEYNKASMLTEDERGIIQSASSVPSVATDPDPARYRSLASDTESLELETTWNTALGTAPDAGAISINGNFTHEFSRSLSGLDTVLLTYDGNSALRTLDDNPLARRTSTNTFALASSLNKPLGDWQLAVTLDGTHAMSESKIDQKRDVTELQELAAAGLLPIDGDLPAVAPGVVARAQTDTTTISSLATLSGHPIVLPSGEVSVTFDAGYGWNRITSNDTRSDAGEIQLTRGDLSAGINMNIPIASAREGFLEPLGELSLNLGGGINRLSDFGTLNDWTAGLNWRPTERLSFQASYIEREAAPGLSALGDAIIVTPNVSVYDFATGETVLVDVTTGGNPNLVAETQHDIKLSANYEIDLFDRANIVVEYFRNRSKNVTESFPLLTAEIEAAFPDRVVRDDNGTLVSIDRRSVSFAERNSSRIRYGFNVFGKFGKATTVSGENSGGRGGVTPAPASASIVPGGGGAAQGAPGTGSPGFDPERFQQLRAQLCSTDSQTVPDISALPPRMQERLRGADGQVDPAKLAEVRTRMCSADGTPPGGPGGMDPERAAVLRQSLCNGWDPARPDAAPMPDLSALPERFQQRLRGADGQIDPTKLAELRTRICSAPEGQPQGGQGAGGEGGGQAQGGRSGGARASGGGAPGMPGRGGDGRGRWNMSLYHSIELENEALIAVGVPVLDLLDGDALSSGGVSRHNVELEGGFFHRGFGVRLSGNYASATDVDGSGLAGSSDLHFDDLATFNLRLFANLEEQAWLVGSNPGFFKGSNLSLRVNNLFDAHRRVTDQNGEVPLSYQPGLVDPLGRTVTVQFRKMF